MSEAKVHLVFPGRIIFLGFGSIGQGVLPLILRHINVARDRISILTAWNDGEQEAREYGVRYSNQPLTPENLPSVLDELVRSGDFVLNLSVDVSSAALIEYCSQRGALYLDTCIEPWPGGYTDPTVPAAQRTNYMLREQVLALHKGAGPTAVLTHGANPGLASHFVKQALLNIARDLGNSTSPRTRAEWGALARMLNVKVIHVAEYDSQVSTTPKRTGEFVNTWSVDGFISEGSQPCELGWGTHERQLPPDGHRHTFGCGASIYLQQPGAATKVRTWTPNAGPFHGFAITHGESISIADYLAVREQDSIVYRPTVHYAYRPCNDAVLSIHELAGRNFVPQGRKRILMDEIAPGGIDELGVLLAGHGKNAYWFGSQLSIDEARELAPHNNATSLQVSVACMAGMIWAIENPRRGIVEPDEIDFQRILELSLPYLGPVVGVYTEWTPLEDREHLFAEDLDKSDPWQFKNVRVL